MFPRLFDDPELLLRREEDLGGLELLVEDLVELELFELLLILVELLLVLVEEELLLVLYLVFVFGLTFLVELLLVVVLGLTIVDLIFLL